MSQTLRMIATSGLTVVFVLCQGCPGTSFTSPPVQTGILVTNLSKQFYAAVGLREHDSSNDAASFFLTPLLAPGAAFRSDFVDAVGDGCPGSVDLRLLLYRRINDDVPIGLDPGEEVEQTPIVAGELLDVPYCDITPLVDFTIAVWDAPEGSARVKLAQGTGVDDALRASGRFSGPDFAWELDGVEPALTDDAPPPLAPSVPIAGRVTLADGTAISGVGVLLRTPFRTRLGAPIECVLPEDASQSDDPDAGYGDPINFTTTDANGAFSLDRPTGGYQVEFFSDDFTFRPAVICVEAPVAVIQSIAEPL